MSKGKGGPEHQKAQCLIRDYYQARGMVAVIEAFLGNKNIDVLVQDPETGQIIAIEYQTTIKHALENVLLDHVFCDEVILVSADIRVLGQMKRKIDGNGAINGQKVKYRLLKEFIPQ
ncbi:hypothetical protein HZA73_09580 [candidate division TA06 bacterium]|nr:hypothetical protein [candidate division TA06 bacterium]